MRINVYSRTGLPTKNYGLRIFMQSPPGLHYRWGGDNHPGFKGDYTDPDEED